MALRLFDMPGKNRLEQFLQIPAEQEEKAQNSARDLLCAACGHPVTRDDQRISVAGGHTHDCTNPHGLRFRIGCFASAPGCRIVGDGYLENTWFAGYSWRVTLCHNCHEHLGWYFRADERSFFGLILARLRFSS